MKISNSKFMKVAAYALLFASFLPIFGIILSNQIHLSLFFWVITALLLFFLIKIRSTEIEDSGGCFIIRQVHPLAPKGYVRPKVEFPISLINQFMVKEGFVAHHLHVKINSRNSRKKIHLDLLFFNRKEIKMLQSFMQNQLSY